jgi:hypothetical protein
VASRLPAPTPIAYKRQSVDVHERSTGSEVDPTESRFIGMTTPFVEGEDYTI